MAIFEIEMYIHHSIAGEAAMIIASKIFQESMVIEGKSVPFFREDPRTGYTQTDNLPLNAMFIDLQKLNIDNTGSVRRFIEHYGVPQLGSFGALFRLSRLCGKRHPYPIRIEGGMGGVELDCCRLALPFAGCLGYGKGMEDWAATTHFAKSEGARRLNHHSAKAPKLQGGIISVAEAKYVLRLLQNGTAILAARDCFGGDAASMADYLLESVRPQSKRIKVEAGTPVFMYQHLDHSRTIMSRADVEYEIVQWSKDEADANERRHAYDAWRESDIENLVDETKRFFAAAKRPCTNDANGPYAKALFKMASSDPAFSGFEEDDSTTIAFIEGFEGMLASGEPWRICENPRCRNLYKHHREYDPDSNRRFKPSKYCSNSCRVSAQHALG